MNKKMSKSPTPTDEIKMQSLKEGTSQDKPLKEDADCHEELEGACSGEMCNNELKDGPSSSGNATKTCQPDECLDDVDSCQVTDNQAQPSLALPDVSQQSPENFGSDSELSSAEESLGDWSSSDESPNSETICQLFALHKRQLKIQKERMALEQKFYKRKLELQKEKFELEKKKLKLEYNCVRELLTLKQEMREKIDQYEGEKIADRINNNS